MKEHLKKYRKFYIFLISLFIFYYILHELLENEIMFIDTYIINIFSHKNDVLTFIMKFISNICSIPVLLIITFLFYLFDKDKRDAYYIATNAFIVFVINFIIKYIIERPRPSLSLIFESGYSFPSAHSMESLAFFGFIAYIIWKKNISKCKKLLVIIPLCILILLIGISRIYLGVHYPSDVIGGFALSTAYLMLFINYLYNKS